MLLAYQLFAELCLCLFLCKALNGNIWWRTNEIWILFCGCINFLFYGYSNHDIMNGIWIYLSFFFSILWLTCNYLCILKRKLKFIWSKFACESVISCLMFCESALSSQILTNNNRCTTKWQCFYYPLPLSSGFQQHALI